MPEEQRTAVFEAKKKQIQDERVAYWKENQLVPPCKESERGSITGEPQGIEAKAAAIVDRCGNVLWSKNGQEKMQVASTTKVPTMLVAVHYGNKNDKITYSKHASAIVGSGGDRAVGYTNGLDDELHKMISESNNKTTVAVGAHIGGIIDPEAKTEYQKLVAFMKEMNEMVKKVGAVNSYFINPNGLGGGGQATEETTNAGSGTYIDYLPDSPAYDEWYSTAEDMAMITRAAFLQNEWSRDIMSTYKNWNTWEYSSIGDSRSLGGKTGTTEYAHLVTAINIDGREYYTAVLGEKDKGYARYADTKRLYAVLK